MKKRLFYWCFFLFSILNLNAQEPPMVCSITGVSNITTNSAVLTINFQPHLSSYMKYGPFWLQVCLSNQTYYYNQSGYIGPVNINLGQINSNNYSSFSNYTFTTTVTGLQPLTNYTYGSSLFVYTNSACNPNDQNNMWGNSTEGAAISFTTAQQVNTHIGDTILANFNEKIRVSNISPTSCRVNVTFNGPNWTTLGQKSVMRNLFYGPMQVAYSLDKTNWTVLPKLKSPGNTSFNINGLTKGVKYFVRSQVSFDTLFDGTNQVGYTLYSQIDSFKTRSPSNNISENYIYAKGYAVCPSPGSSATYITPQIQGVTPDGGNGTYNAIWEAKPAGSTTWTVCPESSDSLTGYTPLASPVAGSVSSVSYRRTVFSGTYKSVSNEITFYYMPQNYKPVINVTQVEAPGSGIRLRVNVYSTVAEYQITWKDSFPNAKSYFLNNRQVCSIKNSTDSIYWAEVSMGSGCPIYKSSQIYITPPDGDGNIYPAVKINKQYWTISNLRTTTFNDGTAIKGYVDVKNNKSAAFSWYNNDQIGNSIRYGALYNVTVIQNDGGKNACPVNWKVAGYNDWAQLLNNSRNWFVGNDLKSVNGWNSGIVSSDINNFNASAAGQMGSDGSFLGEGLWGIWWAIVYSGFPDTSPALTDDKIMRAVKLIAADNRAYINIPAQQNSIRCVSGY